MDIRTYVTLEQSLSQRLQKTWVKQYGPTLTQIDLAIAAEDFDTARGLTLGLDLSTVGETNQQYIRYVLQALTVFGAGSVSSIPGVLLDPLTQPFLENATRTFLLFLEHGGTLNLQRSILQSIAKAERDQQVVQGVQKAERKVRPFVSFKKDGDEQLQLISSLHSSRLATWGFTAEAELAGVEKYRLDAVLDGRTSDFCRMINGKEFYVSDARAKIMEVLAAQDPNDLKTIQPWPNQSKASMDELSSLSPTELVARGLHIPPFHPGCRTLLSLVSKTSRLVRPTPKPTQELPPAVATQEGFKQLGLNLSEKQVEHWNAYMGVDPAQWLSKLSGKSPLEALEGVFGKNAIKIAADGDILTTVKGTTNGVKFQVGSIFEPLSGKFYLSQAQLLAGDVGAESAFMKNLLSSMLEAGESVGGSSVAVSVGVHAYEFGKLGFVPTPAKWQEIRVDLLNRLTEGDLVKLLASLKDEQKNLLLNLLGNQAESALGVLVDLPWTYRGEFIGEMLLKNVEGVFELDLTDTAHVAKAKDYLK